MNRDEVERYSPTIEYWAENDIAVMQNTRQGEYVKYSKWITLEQRNRELEEEVRNLRLRIKAVDQEHEQLTQDRTKMAQAYQELDEAFKGICRELGTCELERQSLQADNKRLKNDLAEAGQIIKGLVPLGDVTKDDIIWAQEQLSKEAPDADR